MHAFDKLTPKKRPASRRLIGLVVVAAVILGFGAVAGAFVLLGGQTQPEQGGTPKDAGILQRLANASGEPRNILVMGVDKRPDRGSEVKGTRADTIMLFRVYPDTGRIKVLSIPRDLLVEIEPGVQDKVNASYAYDGVSGAVGTVEKLTGAHVDHYAVVDFVGFEKIIDSIGGVRLDPDENAMPPNWRARDGVQRLNGRNALIYARSRSTQNGDLDRIQRQQQMLAALRSQAFSWRSVKKLPEITRILNDNVETDMSVTGIASLGKAVGSHGRGALMTSTQLKGTPDTLENGSKVLVPDDEANAAILAKFLD